MSNHPLKFVLPDNSIQTEYMREKEKGREGEKERERRRERETERKGEKIVKFGTTRLSNYPEWPADS